jgi:tetrapyrrole methylase family protein/MazG family protein
MSLAEMDELWEQAKRQLKPEEKTNDFATAAQQT